MNRRHFLHSAVAGGAAVLSPARVSARVITEGNQLSEPSRETQIIEDVDVVVCGAGPAGVTAAIMAARAGSRVRLLEVHGCLGGVWTAGLLSLVLDMNKPGFNQELKRRLAERAPLHSSTRNYFYDPEEMKLLLEELCVQAGVKVQLFTRVVAVQKDGFNRLTAVITESKAGREAWRARVFIDATGDGDVGALAGCRWEVGQAEACPCQPMTLMAMVAIPNPAELRKFATSSDKNSSWQTVTRDEFRSELGRAGIEPSYGLPSLFHVRERLFNLMINHEYAILPYDADAVTRATMRARAEVHRVVRGLRSLGGHWDGLQLVATAEQIGIRDGRRIRGRYRVTRDDLVTGRRLPDAVTRPTFPVDIHAATPEQNRIAGATLNKDIEMKPYDIPLRALIAADVDGLMMAGRCISGDFVAHASYRVTGNAVAMGEAAGVVAALAATSGRLPQEIPWEEVVPLRSKLWSSAGGAGG